MTFFGRYFSLRGQEKHLLVRIFGCPPNIPGLCFQEIEESEGTTQPDTCVMKTGSERPKNASVAVLSHTTIQSARESTLSLGFQHHLAESP